MLPQRRVPLGRGVGVPCQVRLCQLQQVPPGVWAGGIDPSPPSSLHASRSTMALCFYAVTEVLILSGHLQVPRSPLGEGAAREALGATWYSAETLGIRVDRMVPWRRRCLCVGWRRIQPSFSSYVMDSLQRPTLCSPSSRGRTSAELVGPLNTLAFSYTFLYTYRHTHAHTV